MTGAIMPFSNKISQLSPFEESIVNSIKIITNPKTGLFKKVYPLEMVSYVPCTRSVRQMRRDMARLAEKQFLERLGPRKGYRLHPQYLN